MLLKTLCDTVTLMTMRIDNFIVVGQESFFDVIGGEHATPLNF